MKAATGAKKKKKRSPGSEVSAASSGPSPSAVSGSSAGNSKHSEKFQKFLDRRASREAASPPQQISTENVSNRAENSDSMADRDNRETGAFPTDPNAKSQDTMMQTLSSQNLEDNEAEI